MTGLLSPVALFLPGTTHDYAIWQAGPSILASDGLARDERAEAAAAGEPVAAAVALGDGRAGQPPLNEHLPQALASHGRVLRQERLHVSDLLEQYLLEPRRVQVSGLAGTGELVELAHQVALLRLGRRLRDPRDPPRRKPLLSRACATSRSATIGGSKSTRTGRATSRPRCSRSRAGTGDTRGSMRKTAACGGRSRWRGTSSRSSADCWRTRSTHGER